MHQMGMTPNAIATTAGCARTTVVGILKNAELVRKYTNHDLVSKLKKAFPDRIFAKCSAALESIDLDDASMSQMQRATIFGILFDKHRLSEERATHIVDYGSLSQGVIDIDAKIHALEEKLRLKNVTPAIPGA